MQAKVTALARDGRVLPGWPYDPPGSLYTCSGCTPGPGAPLAPAFGRDGTVFVYVEVDQSAEVEPVGQVVAIDPAGKVKPGWPQRAEAGWLTVGPDDRLYIESHGRLSLTTPPFPAYLECFQPVDPSKATPCLGCDFVMTPVTLKPAE